MNRRSCVLLLMLAIAPAAMAQSTLSVLAGRVAAGGGGAPGVTVSVSSPALQGTRTTVSGPDGQYELPALPPGDYLITFTLEGMQQSIKRAALRLAETTRVDASLAPLAIHEEITVHPAPATVLATPQVSTNLDAATVEMLPGGRGILDFTKLVAGVNTVGTRNLLAISGAQPYDNLYMVNGVTITNKLDNQPLNLYIEDAIQEATILTAGVSAEYGRFTGGVVNVITKSGGNTLSGTLRDTLSSDRWTANTPFPGEVSHLTGVDHEYQATLGGALHRDRLWFFVAGRYASRGLQRQTQLTNNPYVNNTGENREEAKLTADLTSSQTLVGSYLGLHLNHDNVLPATDLRALYDVHSIMSLSALRYTGVFAQNVVVEGQASWKRNASSTTSNLPGVDSTFIGGTTVADSNGIAGAVWAPPFCVSCGTDYGDSRDELLKISRFIPSRRFGTHELTVGVDDYHELGQSLAHTSSSDFSVFGEVFNVGKDAYLHAVPGETTIEWAPIPPGSRADFSTRSAFVNDQISAGTHLTFNAGLRYDSNKAVNEDGRRLVDDSRVSPRLGLTYDVDGNGTNRISASFGRYTSKALEGALQSTESAFSPTTYDWTYDGPEINADGDPLVPTTGVMRLLYAWFQARGGTAVTDDADVFATLAFLTGPRLSSPAVNEYTLGYGHQFGTSGFVRINYVNRQWFDFYTVHVTTHTRDSLGDRIVVDNNDRGLTRKYDAIALQGNWRHRPFTLAGNYTWSRLRGNVEQESNGFPTPEDSAVDWFPELSAYPQFAPVGYLAGDMRHVANVWAGYDISTGRYHLNLSVLERYHSGRDYNARAPIQLKGVLPNPGYANFPGLQYYFLPRGSLRLPAVSSTGVAINASHRIKAGEVFAQVDVSNVFSESRLENPASIDTTVFTTVRDKNLAPFNPMTKTPVLCPAGVSSSSAQCRGIANYRFSPTFGQARSANAYQTPRTYGVSVGARF